MLNLKMKLQSLVKKTRMAFIKLQMESVHNRQREERFKLTLASAMRISAQEQFDERTDRNATRLTKLIHQLEALEGVTPLWMGVDLASPVPDESSVSRLADTVLADREAVSLAATELELRLAAGQATAGQTVDSDASLDWPLPCDIKVGPGTIRRGVPLRTLALRMNMLHAMAMQAYPTAANMAVDPAGTTAS